MKQRAVPILVAVAILGMTACAPSAPDRVVKKPTVPVVVPAPTPTPFDFDPATVPDIAFGGDCAALFTGAELSALIGATVPDPKGGLADLAGASRILTQNGGMDCAWGDLAASDEALRVYATVIPHAAIPEAAAASDCRLEGLPEERYGTCDFTILSGGLALARKLTLDVGSTKSKAISALAEMSDAFAAKTAAVTVPGVRMPTAGAWPLSVDCDDLEASVNLTALFDMGSPVVTTGGNAPLTFSATDSLAEGHGWTSCTWDTVRPAGSRNGVDIVGVQVFADSAWIAKYLTSYGAVSELKFAGADRAVLLSRPSVEGNADRIWVFSGSNAMEIGTDEGPLSELYPAVPKLLAALNELR
ncbi:hypothetical protein EYE40_00390 [Glaciihabitans arcticus]|uniref:DUF3558 domain-containing protein n=1 Tax=Glaciihabitans arcticus TaxID=2668039 RepID=A0A4Q9GSA8_9MICO|nr:hypothetical protein [Glaciihabitans arcticus]TBN55977.1 hypothetical protein EYE40_00390 [Glaciihabitans arcticus]